jgi:hypothetical protein
VIAHPKPAAAPSPKVFDKLQARLAAKPARLVAAFLGDDWTTQGDWMGRYGRQVHAFPGYGTAGWASETFKIDLQVGPHQSKNKGGPYTYFHGLKATNDRVLYLPNTSSRYPGEWNDGSFDRDAYHDEWEGPDLWVSVTVPAGTHRLSAYFMNVDAHGPPPSRRRDFLVELKAHAPTIAEADFAPPLARARVTQWYGGVYKQFVVAGPASYHLKIGRNYSMATKVNGVFLDRVDGPAKPNEPSGVPLMGEHQILPPAAPAVDAPDAATRAAIEVVAALDKSWSDAAAAPLQRAGRLLAIRLAQAQGAPPALIGNWRFALPITTDDDHLAVAKTIDVSQQAQFGRNPQMVPTYFRTRMREAWKRLEPLVKANTAPDPAAIPRAQAQFATPDALRIALAQYLQLRAGQAIDTADLNDGAITPDPYFAMLKASEKDPKALYRQIGELLLYSDAMAKLKADKPHRQGVAAAMACARAATELLDDTWLAARIGEGQLLPQLDHATKFGPLTRHAILTALITAHADDPKGLAASFKSLTDATTSKPAAALNLEFAQAFKEAKRPKDALEYLDKIPAELRTAEAEALRSELAKP